MWGGRGGGGGGGGGAEEIEDRVKKKGQKGAGHEGKREK